LYFKQRCGSMGVPLPGALPRAIDIATLRVAGNRNALMAFEQSRNNFTLYPLPFTLFKPLHPRFPALSPVFFLYFCVYEVFYHCR
jgi:hypothetical protein